MTSSQKSIVEGGLYQHYKGMMYRVHSICRHSETLEELVYYETLYDNDLGKFWVRPKDMFLGKVLIDGVEKDRFAFMGHSSDEA